MLHNERARLPRLILFLLIGAFGLLQQAAARCNRPEDLANGHFIVRRNYVRNQCNFRYTLMGDRTQLCGLNGRISGERPFCARPSCPMPDMPANGIIEVQRDLKAVVVCFEDYVAAGNPYAYCNGYNWDRPLGTCRHRTHIQSHACDFESEDLCGWVTQLTLQQPWKRVATVAHYHSYRTGPRHDHTVQNAYGGHYMLMETTQFATGAHHLISPIYPRELSLKTACCFRFHYFMYGSGVGGLVVSVKPKQLHVTEMWERYRNDYKIFEISGNQGNQWLEHTISIGEMSQDFQVVFTATDATSHLGDIAIDDVKLLTGSECGGEFITTTTEQPVRETAEPVVYDLMNCSQRCGQPAPLDEWIQSDGKLIKACSCEIACVLTDIESCCPDYISTCFPNDETTLEDNIVPTTMPTTTPTTTTTKLTTTSTVRPTTTTARATTTRRTPPTTTPTTTTTSTTPLPTTSTTTSTTRRAPITTTTTQRATTRSTTKRPTPKTTPTTTTTIVATTKATTPTTTTTVAAVATSTRRSTTSATSTAVPQKVTGAQMGHNGKRVSWPVSSKDLMGDIDKEASPARFMWYLLLAIMLIVVVASISFRWANARGATIEKAVSFQKTLSGKLKKATLLRGNRLATNEANASLCDNTDDNDVQFEEMGVDIRNISEL